MAHLLLLLLAALCAAPSRGAPLFGFYDDSLASTPWASIHQASTLADASSSFAQFRVPSLLSVYGAVFQGSPTRMTLQPNWQPQLTALIAAAAPLLHSGAVLGFNLGDELVWNCLAPSNLTLVANAVRAQCPRGSCLLWYNEAAVFGSSSPFHDSCGNLVSDWAIPAALDLFSTDIYHFDGVVEGWVAARVKTFYDSWIFPFLTPQQRVVLVPGSYGSNVNHYPNGTYICDKACYDAMCAHDAQDFAAWAAQDARIAGVFPWNWGGCASCNGSRWTPPHTCCMDELGTAVMPQTAAAWEALYGAHSVGTAAAAAAAAPPLLPAAIPLLPAATYTCNVTVAGGSLSAVAAALAAADADPSQQVCLLELTDWPGGQATSGGTSAIDFGATSTAYPANLPRGFADILSSPPFGSGNSNPAQCTVSSKCFLPEAMAGALLRHISLRPNLRLFLSTAVTGVTRSPATGRITALAALQRSPAPGTQGYEANLSAALPDWYSAAPSPAFAKAPLLFAVPPGGVVVEGTEFGDVLVLSGVRVAQGVESPLEDSSTGYDQACGQATTVCFWQSWGRARAPAPDPTPGQGLPPSPHLLNASALNHSLTWRRSVAGYSGDLYRPHPGDTAMLNQYNDQDIPPGIFLPLALARAQAAAGQWAGGLNLTSLRLAEEKAYFFYWQLKRSAAAALPQAAAFYYLNASAAGTGTGLAKLPYLREGRRSQFGVQGFRLCHAPLAVGGAGDPGCWLPPNGTAQGFGGAAAAAGAGAEQAQSAQEAEAPGVQFGFRWRDTVAIGQYDFDIHTMDCPLPAYLAGYYKAAARYYLPFRALTSWDAPNLLIPGKGMAQTFYASAATRLHPEEWATGSVAGLAASLMSSRNLTAAQLYASIEVLQQAINASRLVPMLWTTV